MTGYTLEYKGSETHDSGTLYRFIHNGEPKKLSLPQAIALINQVKSIPKAKLNCKVSNGTISYKAGMGINKPIDMRTKKSTDTSVKKIVSVKQYPKEVNIIVSKQYDERLDILSNDQCFIETSEDFEFLKRHEDVMRRIDRVSKFYPFEARIKTPYGIGTLQNLSTGCKTVLNALWLAEQGKPIVINIDEANSFFFLYPVLNLINNMVYLFVSDHSFVYGLFYLQ